MLGRNTASIAKIWLFAVFLGLIDTLANYLNKTSKLYHKNLSPGSETSSGPDMSSVVECLTQLLSLLKAMLDRVTMFVKEALQVRN